MLLNTLLLVRLNWRWNTAQFLGVKLQTTTDVLKKIYKSQGIKGLFAGFTPRVVKVAPACAIMISTYEYGKSFFMRYNKQQKQQSKSLSNNSEDIKCKVDSQ